LPAEYLAALAALCWAFGSLFSATAASQLGAFSFTRWRLFFALVLLWAVALYTGQWRSLDLSSVAWLALSGLIGIFVGDTALFACMNRLGPPAQRGFVCIPRLVLRMFGLGIFG